jgi:hypothetical protein
MQEHLQNLVSQGYMMAAELTTCRVPGDPNISCSGGGIRHGMHNILRAGISYAITLISLLFAVVLWLQIASHDPFGDLAHGGLCDHV